MIIKVFKMKKNVIKKPFNPIMFRRQILLMICDALLFSVSSFLALWLRFEFDIFDDWDKFEEFLKLISGKDDIFYGTNREVLL